MIQAPTDPPRHNFDPSMTARYDRGEPLPPDVLVKYSPKWQYSRLMNFPFQGSHFRPRMRSVVIAVDGASRGNHDSSIDSQAAWGVYFGKNCAFNRCGLVAGSKQTNNVAELEGVRQALKTVIARRANGEIQGWREIIIKLDSQVVARTFEEWVWNWANNGWRTSRNKPVENQPVVQDIHSIICGMEADNMAVRFWRVGREWNKEADALANEALDAYSDSGYEV